MRLDIVKLENFVFRLSLCSAFTIFGTDEWLLYKKTRRNENIHCSA